VWKISAGGSNGADMKKDNGPVETEEGWTIRSNVELETSTRGECMVKYIKAQRVKQWGRLKRLENIKTVGTS
jgi:hypothetical protein